MHRVRQPVLHQGMPFLAQHLEDGQVRVTLDQGFQRLRSVVQRAAEVAVLRLAQHLADTRHALAPQPRQLDARSACDVGRRGPQFGQVDQAAALEQTFQLLRRLHHLAACKQQRGVLPVHVERQGLAGQHPMPDEGQGRVTAFGNRGGSGVHCLGFRPHGCWT